MMSLLSDTTKLDRTALANSNPFSNLIPGELGDFGFPNYHSITRNVALDPELLQQATLELLHNLREDYSRYNGEGLGDGTSHRADLGIGNRMVSSPIRVPKYYDTLMRQGSQLLVDTLAQEDDDTTVRRVNQAFSSGLKESGIEELSLFNPETILAVKRAAVEDGRLTSWCDFVPVPVAFDSQNRLIPVPIDDAQNNWRDITRLAENGSLMIAFLMIEGQGSFAGYFGFAHSYLKHGAFNATQTTIDAFEHEVSESVFGGHSDFTVVDYKILERPGERHHLPGDKFVTNNVWGAGISPIDPRDLLEQIESGELDGVRLVNTCTAREYGVVMRELGPEKSQRLKQVLNDVDAWVEHPAAFGLVTKGSMAKAYEKHGAASMMIPSFSTVDDLESRLHFTPDYIVSKPVGGDSGYGLAIGTVDEVKAAVGKHPGRLVQPLIDILRIAPNRLSKEQGVLSKGGAVELRSVNISGFGFSRIGGHSPYRPDQEVTMVHQEYIMKSVQALVEHLQNAEGIDQATAWKKMLLMANAGFGMFKVS